MCRAFGSQFFGKAQMYWVDTSGIFHLGCGPGDRCRSPPIIILLRSISHYSKSEQVAIKAKKLRRDKDSMAFGKIFLSAT
jgi:hypothetical protein